MKGRGTNKLFVLSILYKLILGSLKFSFVKAIASNSSFLEILRSIIIPYRSSSLKFSSITGAPYRRELVLKTVTISSNAITVNYISWQTCKLITFVFILRPKLHL